MYTKEELKKLKMEFWEGFASYCEVQPYLRERKKIWTLYNTKVKGVELKFEANRRNASVMIEINLRTEEQRLEMFERLTWYKDTLENEMNDGLIWDMCYTRESGNEVARIYTSTEGFDMHRRKDWGEFYQFMATRMFQLEKNFLSISEYLRE